MKKKILCVVILMVGGCAGESVDVEPGISVVDGLRSESDGPDALPSRLDMGRNLDLGRDQATNDGADIDAGEDSLADGRTQGETPPFNPLDDGLCWYRHECPVGHWRCENADGTPVGDAQCLTKRNICICCDAPVPAFSCVGL